MKRSVKLETYRNMRKRKEGVMTEKMKKKEEEKEEEERREKRGEEQQTE